MAGTVCDCWPVPDTGESRPQQEPRTLGDVLAGVRVSTAVAFLGFVGLAAGSLGPWVATVLGSAAGTHGDGKITLGAAAIAALALLIAQGRTGGAIVAGLAAAVGLGVAGYDLVHIQHAAAHATLFGPQLADAGWGVYVALVGAAVALTALVSAAPMLLRGTVTVVAVVGSAGAIVAGQIVVHQRASNASGSTAFASPTTNAQATTASTTNAPAANTTATNSATTGTTSASGLTSTPTGSYGGVAPLDLSGPATDQAGCGDEAFTVGPPTSCPFATNVFDTARSGYAATGQVPATVVAFSPVTHETYRMKCGESSVSNEVICSNYPGNAVVVFDTSVLRSPGLKHWTTCPTTPTQDVYLASSASPGCGFASAFVSQNHTTLSTWAATSAVPVGASYAGRNYTLHCIAPPSSYGELVECSYEGVPWVRFDIDSARGA
jgi:hypothetical protein